MWTKKTINYVEESKKVEKKEKSIFSNKQFSNKKILKKNPTKGAMNELRINV